MHEVIIVGAGAAGIAAALEFTNQGVRPLVLDVGETPSGARSRVVGNLYDHRRQNDTFDLMIGDRLQGLSNLLGDHPVPVKLTTPNLDYVTQNARGFSPLEERDFSAIQSFAKGGLANAWGAGLYRYTDRDLTEFPIREADLSPFFDALTQEIGISGADDDLTPFFGSTRFLLPSIRLSKKVSRLYARYVSKKKSFGGKLHIGHARIGVLTRPYQDRPEMQYDNLEFWQEQPSIYNPRMTLDRLIQQNKVIYHKGFLAESWTETAEGVRVEGKAVDSKERVSFLGKKLVLAAGAINTARLVLRAGRDCQTRLRLLENPALQLPLVCPGFIGRPLETHAFGLAQLNLIWESEAYPACLQGSLMEINSPMRAEFFGSLPYAAHANLALIRYLLPSMLLMQLYFPAAGQKSAALSLKDNGQLLIQGHSNTLELGPLKMLLRHLRRLGAWTFPNLIVHVPTGHAIHYAGTIPMKRDPHPYTCDVFGKLYGTQNVFIGDSASFPALPAKNMSFAMMANAQRVAQHVVETLRVTHKLQPEIF